ncbi:membrane metallo-endopeptidase-like 1 [Dermacentor andersoni]|uniref:membrane metallo-endopeptidase-like 1 n=1 Tax=Dermacentor andersoni TaxID=34620 RepID=UPI00215592DF|nr:membrane metallo-endopeptidase-like 1 [Dermacentor andersoni]
MIVEGVPKELQQGMPPIATVPLGYAEPRWNLYLAVTVVGAMLVMSGTFLAPAGLRFVIGCQSPQCGDWFEDLAVSISPRRKPCDDFYEFVCANRNTTQGATVNAFLKLQIRVALSFFKRLLLVDTDLPDTSLVSAHVKTARLMQRCMQEAINGADDLHFVTDFLAQYNLSWPPAQEPAVRAAQEERSVVDLLVELSLVRGVHPLLRIVPDVYFKRRGYYSLHVEFNLAFMYEWAAVRKLLLATGRLAPFFEITALLLSGRRPHPQLVERLMALDNMLLTAALPPMGDRPNMTTSYVRFGDLSNLTSPSFPGQMLLDAVNRVLPPRRRLSEDDELVVTNGPYLRAIGQLLGPSPASETLRAYVTLMLVRYLAPSTSSRLVSSQLPVEGNALNAVLFRLAHCVADAIQLVPYVMGDLFVRWHLDEKELDGARDIVGRVRNATRAGFLALRWIDEETRRGALRRIDNLASLVGHPDNVSRVDQLNRHYAFLPAMRGSYAHMLTASRDADAHRLLRRLRASEPFFPAVDVELPMILVNAFYLPIYHVMVIPPAIMFAPFYRRALPAALNYGSLGHVVGHEITHGFDPELSLYNESGLREDWWTARSRANFEQRVKCLRRLYNEAPWSRGVNYGDTALSENFADCGGLDKVYRSFKSLGPQPSQRLGDESYTADQLFFISSCYKWCTVEGAMRGRSSSPSDESEAIKFYSPMHMRCNVPLMNMPEFAEHFSCAPGTVMNPRVRCETF